jgi:Flp pilus assembly protein TadD
MSLLLEALKKAEKAKEEAQRRERGPEPSGGDAAPEARPVMTRAELPDIKQPLEILSDDIAPREAPAAPPAARPEPSREREPQAAERAAARRVFEAKFREPNPRLPFFLTLGVLGAFALGTVGYFWYQLRPPPSLVNANPVRTAAASEAPVQLQVAEIRTAPAPTPSAFAGLPAAAPAPSAAPPQPELRVEAPAPPPKPAPRISRPAPAEPAGQIALATAAPSRPAPQIHPRVQTAYAAYLQGDLATAQHDYQEALREDPTNRDALLGRAAIEVRSGRLESAEATYLRLLQIDPRDPHAQAGLIALRGSRLDPLTTESRVKSMLAADPGANVLHFTLGNQLAQQGRWAEAQDEYFKAFAASPNNADFAYNLAVSLDHLRQDKSALDYYRRAIALAEGRGSSFSVAAARQRAAQLEK